MNGEQNSNTGSVDPKGTEGAEEQPQEGAEDAAPPQADPDPAGE